MSILESTDTALATVAKVRDALHSVKSGSLVEYTSAARVEPLVLLDSGLRHQLYITDVLQAMVSIFSGYYLQAVAISCNIGNIDTMRMLDKLNPKRDVAGSAGRGITRAIRFGREDFSEGLPFVKEYISLEQNKDRVRRTGTYTQWTENLIKQSSDETKKEISAQLKEQTKETKDIMRKELRDADKSKTDPLNQGNMSAKFGKDTIANIETSTNLSVGKLLEVQISDGDKSATIPVSIRLITKIVGGASLATIMTLQAGDRSAKERYHAWRAGELDFFKDLILCQDIIEQHKKAALADKDGTINATMNRVQKNKLSALLSGDVSVATASSIVIVTTDTARLIERQLNGRLSNFRIRENMFKVTYTMLLVIIDTQWEQAVIYHRSISEASEISIKEFKASSKGNGPDVSEILAAYRAGSAPSI